MCSRYKCISPCLPARSINIPARFQFPIRTFLSPSLPSQMCWWGSCCQRWCAVSVETRTTTSEWTWRWLVAHTHSHSLSCTHTHSLTHTHSYIAYMYIFFSPIPSLTIFSSAAESTGSSPGPISVTEILCPSLPLSRI